MAKAVKTIYPKLKLLISERGYSQKEIAQSVDMHPRTFCEKLKGKYSFSLDEAIDIKEKFFPDVAWIICIVKKFEPCVGAHSSAGNYSIFLSSFYLVLG